ncbi:hypothetical protein E2562_008979 [Oryza meyeriana var. granulata]|uniref:Cytochrome P450 n=1 Tax=Oryza meyeriana var. granulata TaxID=110450 RepID=A0A6G1D0W3_9ORYZ|nr:hypothetical protein E2562_008979 [Oryza meyeriana var. granulata]
MFGEVPTLLRELNDSMRLVTVVLPYLPIPTHCRQDRARARFDEIFTDIVRSRRSSGSGRASHNDMLQCLIHASYKDGHNEHVVTIIIVKNNLTSVTRDIDGHLHRCVKETLRLQPSTLMLLRHARRSFVVRARDGGAEYEVLAEHMVASPVVVHNSHTFTRTPRRFGRERKKERAYGADLAYTAFGGGRHACISDAFAYMQIKVIWSHLLRSFQLELMSPFPEMDWNVVMPGPNGKVMVSYKRRKLQ